MWLLFCLFFAFFGENAYILHSQQISNIQNRSINYSHHSVHYIFRTYSSDNWKFVPFDQRLPQGPENNHPILFLWVWHFVPQIPHDIYSICLFFRILHLAWCPPDSSMLLQMAGFPFFIYYIFNIYYILYIYILYIYIHIHTHIYV